MSLKIKKVKELVSDGKIQWRGHMLSRMQQRNIKVNDVIECINTGEIIESYKADYPYPSGLILGFSKTNGLHVVCSVGNNYVWMITTYYPDLEEWFEDLKIRRR